MLAIDGQGGFLVRGSRCVVVLGLDHVYEQRAGITRDDERLFVPDTFGSKCLEDFLATRHQFDQPRANRCSFSDRMGANAIRIMARSRDTEQLGQIEYKLAIAPRQIQAKLRDE